MLLRQDDGEGVRLVEQSGVQREQSQVLTKVFTTMREEGVTRRDIASALFRYPDDLNAITFGLAMAMLDGELDSEVDRTDRPRHLRLV